LIAQASYYSNQSLSVLFQSLDYLTLYSFVLTSLSERLSIQYVYERVFLFLSLVSQSGCKSRKLISNWQMFFEVFFGKFFVSFFFLNLTNLSMNFRCFTSLNSYLKKCSVNFVCGVQM